MYQCRHPHMMGVILRLVRCRNRQLLPLFLLLLLLYTITIIYLDQLTTGHIVGTHFIVRYVLIAFFTRFDLPQWRIKCLYIKLCENQPVSSLGNDTQMHNMCTTRLKKQTNLLKEVCWCFFFFWFEVPNWTIPYHNSRYIVGRRNVIGYRLINDHIFIIYQGAVCTYRKVSVFFSYYFNKIVCVFF